MLTQRALLLGFVAFCLYLVATVNTLPNYYYVLTWLAVGLLAASLAIASLSLVGLELNWKLVRPRGFGRWEHAEISHSGPSLAPPVVELSLLNKGSLNKTGVTLELRARQQGGTNIESLNFLLEALPSGRAATVDLPLDRLPRGVYELFEARLIGSDVLGLFRISRRIKFEEVLEIVVAPPLIETPRREHLSSGRTQRGSRRARRQHQGDELRSLRPYAPGDDVRHVHWKSSARFDNLVVREWEQPGRASYLIVWDGETGEPPAKNTLSAAEVGLSLCGSIATHLLQDGTPTTLLCAGTQTESATDTSTEGSGPLPTTFVDLLARAEAQRKETLTQAFDQSHQKGTFSMNSDAVIVVTASLSPELTRALPSLANRERRVMAILLDSNAFERLNASKSKKSARGAENSSERLETLASQLLQSGVETHVFAPNAEESLYLQLEALLVRVD